MMKGLKWYSLIFSVFLLASLIANIPAAWVYSLFPAQRGVAVSGIEGTVWNGSVQQLKVDQEFFGRIQWSLEPSQLLLAKLQYQVRFGQGSSVELDGKGVVGAGITGLYAKNVLASIPMPQVARFIPMQGAPIDLQGQLELSLTEFDYGQPWCEEAKGSLAWTNGEIITPMGNLSPSPVIADIKCQSQKIDIKGKQNNSQVSSEFSVNLNEQSQYKLASWFKPGADFPSSMMEQLKWLGDPDSQGRYLFNFSGKL
ncbi:MAG: type II secretion system protein N [Vibrio sp.]